MVFAVTTTLFRRQERHLDKDQVVIWEYSDNPLIQNGFSNIAHLASHLRARRTRPGYVAADGASVANDSWVPWERGFRKVVALHDSIAATTGSANRRPVRQR